MQCTGSAAKGWSTCASLCLFSVVFIYPVVMSAGVPPQQPASPGKQADSPGVAAPGVTSASPAAPGKPSPPGVAPTEKNNTAAEEHVSLPAGLDPVKGIPVYETIQEDWSSLAIGVSHLDPQPPLVAQTDEGDGFIRTLVQLKWRPGDPLDVYVVLPKNVKKPPAVLYLYGYKDDTDRFKDDRWCQHATSAGVAAIGFVSALSGHRFHDRPLRQWFVSELQESLGSTVHDVQFILDYLEQRGDIDMKRIGMFGQSSGGTIALLAAAADPRIKAVDVLDPWGDWPVWLKDSWVVRDDPEHARFTDPEFLKRVAPLDPVKWLPTLKSTRTRIQQVMENTATPDECKDAIRKAAPRRAQVVRFDHTGEFMEAAAKGRLFDWIKAQLRTGVVPMTQKSSVVTRAADPGAPKAR